MHYINVVVVSSETRPARIIRFFTRSLYNHASIALDDNFDVFYSFARKKAHSPLDAGFIKEHASYYSLGKNKDIRVKIFRIPVTDKQYSSLLIKLEEIEHDNEYLYNFISAILYPFKLSYKTYKAYYCSEFVATVLEKYTDIKLDKKPSLYCPKDIEKLLNDNLWYEGYISKLTSIEKDNDSFYDKVSIKVAISACFLLMINLVVRRIKF